MSFTSFSFPSSELTSCLPSFEVTVTLSRRCACSCSSSLTFCNRGPAKGYIEGLEHRLHEAETLLLQLLPVVTPDQLAAATASLSSAGDPRDSPERIGRSSPPVLNKKTGIEYWENFPLDTIENIRRWQQDCALHSQFRDHDAALNGPGSSRGASRPSSVDLSRDTATSSAAQNVLPNRKTTMTQYRSMSNDSYPPSKQEYITTPPTTVAQPWNGTAAYMQTYQNDQSWQSQAMGMQHHQNPHQHSQPQMISAGGPMDVDGNFFSSDVKRNLFW